MIERNPEWNLDHRRLLHKIDLQGRHDRSRRQEISAQGHALSDDRSANPYKLSPDEATCLERIKTSFMRSQKLWSHMKFLVSHGTMYLRRDNHLIFHGCVSVNAQGRIPADGRRRKPYAAARFLRPSNAC